MTKTVIEMAREAWRDHPMYGGVDMPDPEKYDLAALERFAALVREEERKACAKVCDEMGKTQFIPNHDAYIIPYKPQDCATAIRARS